jgi:hypothetical protein
MYPTSENQFALKSEYIPSNRLESAYKCLELREAMVTTRPKLKKLEMSIAFLIQLPLDAWDLKPIKSAKDMKMYRYTKLTRTIIIEM